MWNSIIDRGLSWIFPEYCLGCGKREDPLCDNCVALIHPPRDLEEPGLLAALPYEHTWIKKLIWRFKYYRGRHLGPRMADIISEKLLEELAEIASTSVNDQKWLIIPVPISKTRKRERGFNQAELLARALAEKHTDFLTLETKAVVKIKDTPRQAKVLNRQKRLANVIDSFAVTKPKAVYDRRIIIVDDVITTGATMNEIKRILKQSGARVVLGIALAHG